MIEVPVPVDAGLSRKRDQMWGLLGGVLGATVGVGSAAIAVFVEGADLFSSGPYPAFFAKRQLLVYDIFLLFVIFLARSSQSPAWCWHDGSRFPRTDTLGPLIASGVLMVLGGALLFTRLVAVIRGV